jgi:photosystem II stability/assembly factor-like uncharacterized protein
MGAFTKQKTVLSCLIFIMLILLSSKLMNSQTLTKRASGFLPKDNKVHKTIIKRTLSTPDIKLYRKQLNTVAAGSQVTIMSEDFEGDFPSDLWQLSTGNYAWAKRNVAAHNGSYSGWAIGGGTIGSTIPYNTNYPDNISTTMIYGPFDLSDADSAGLNFFVNLNTESGYDFLDFLASNDGTNFYGYALTGTTSGDWVEFSLSFNEVPIDASTNENFCGSQSVYIAFVFASDAIVNYPNGAFVDDIILQKTTAAPALTNDVGVSSLNLPGFLQLGNSLPIVVTVKNYGSQTQTGFPVSYSIDGGTPVTENFTGSLSFGSTATFTFAQQWTPQAEGVYHINAGTNLTNDENRSNDSSTAGKDVTVSTEVNEVVFSEGFESYPVGVLAQAPGSPWVRLSSSRYGDVSTTWPHSGTKNFMISSFTTSTEIDYVNLNLSTKPAVLTVELWYTPDGFFVYKDFAEFGLGYVSSNQMNMVAGIAGSDKNVLFRAAGMSQNVNVYDNLGYGSLGGSPVHNYMRVEFDFNNNLASFYIGSSDQAPLRLSVKFDGTINFNSLYIVGGLNYTYFDDIKISARGTYEMKKISDVGVADINIPAEVGLGASVPVKVVVENYGNIKAGGFSVSYKVNSQPAITETFTDSLDVGATTAFTFSSSWMANLEGVYHFSAWTTLLGDNDTSNDSSTTGKDITVVKYEPDPLGWFSQTCSGSKALLTVHFCDESNGWVAGRDGAVFKTTNGGRTWQDFSFNDQISFLENAKFISSSTGLIAGWAWSNSDIRRTTDGGSTWQGIDLGNAWPKDISFIDMNNGWIAGITASLISVTTDEWGSVSISTTGRHSTIWKTSDGGATWNENVLSISNWLYSIDFSDANTGWAVGDNGLIIKTTNGGTSWTTQSSGTTNYLYEVDFIDLQKGWAVGQSGTIIRTTDGGTTWTSQSSGTTYSLSGVCFTDALNGWVVGTSGLILHTVDGGQTWAQQTSNTGTSLNALCFIDSLTGWIAGSSGTILKTSSAGILVGIDHAIDNLPKTFNLAQNYPNPFNPGTTIRYSIPQISFVTIKVYDILGREIRALVNENKAAGNYSVSFDAGNLASGIYFYTIKAGDFVQTKKMILLK